MAEHGDATSCRRDRARNAPKDGRLPRPVRPAERDTLARLELEIEAIDDVPPTEAAREALHREDEFACQTSTEGTSVLASGATDGPECRNEARGEPGDTPHVSRGQPEAPAPGEGAPRPHRGR